MLDVQILAEISLQAIGLGDAGIESTKLGSQILVLLQVVKSVSLQQNRSPMQVLQQLH